MHPLRFAAVASLLAVLVVAGDVRAQAKAADPPSTLPMLFPHEKHYLRAVLEVGGILFVGFVDYLLNTTDRGGTLRPGEERWRLRYDWPVLRDKLVGTGLNLDGNRYNTNYVSHPLAGTLYFTAARSNHLSFAESYAFAIIGSTTWEYFGEIREPASVNDLIVTPVSGASIGEPLVHLAHFLRRRPGGLAGEALAFVVAPVKSLNEWTEGAVPSHTAPLPWHRFELSLGAGATMQEGQSMDRPARNYFDQRLSASLSIVDLAGYGSGRPHRELFDDGNVSRVQLDFALSGLRLVEGRFATRLVPVGYFVRREDGHGFLLGLRMGFEYGAHDFDRDRLRPIDAIGLASPLGLAFEHSFVRGPLELRAGLDVLGGMSGVTPYGLARYSATRSLDDALTPVRKHGYYHAVSIAAEPFVDVGYGGVRLAASFRLDTFHSIRGLDENEAAVASGPRFSDRRSRLGTTLSFVPAGTPWRLALDVRRMSRAGTAGAIDDERSEISFWGSLGATF